MKWEKKGLIFSVEKNHDWMYSHAMVPFAEFLYDDYFRIYFATRDKFNRSYGAFIDVNILNPKEILQISEKPIIEPGPLGTFDDNGATPFWITQKDNKRYLFYEGWNLGVTVPFYLNIGLAISQDDVFGFKKVSSAPILERNNADPIFTASACVLIEDDLWKMWYVSCEKWEFQISGKPKHYYNIKYAESSNGIEWIRKNINCIPFKNKDEYAISRPCVIKDKGTYKMWYSYRGGEETYRIGYAESVNGIIWKRKDSDAGIDISRSGWDSEMIGYPFVFSHKGVYYMLYNGNNYGKTGFGYAISREREYVRSNFNNY